MQNVPEQSDEELLADLGIEVEVTKKSSYTARDERIIAGFDDIQRFYTEHNRLPQHGEDNDVFERLYATRLDQIARQNDCTELLAALDTQGLLVKHKEYNEADSDDASLDDEALLAELGIAASPPNDITQLTHVKTRAEKKAAEEIAKRDSCEDFDRFERLFEQVQAELKSGERKTIPYRKDGEIRQGQWFIVGGQKAYVAEESDEFTTDYQRSDARLRVIYDNGTESNLLKRSLQRALHRDNTGGRRITEHANEAGPMFAVEEEQGDYLASGTIYVLRSMSDDPNVADKRTLLHKIGVTGGKVENRIRNAENDATFMLAKVEVVATYQLFNIHRHKLENLIHKFLQPARLDIEIKDRFGKPVKPREWFLVPLPAIDEMVEKIQSGKITDFRYDTSTASLVQA
jgi:uncharacterized protein (UPF0147 family)